MFTYWTAVVAQSTASFPLPAARQRFPACSTLQEGHTNAPNPPRAKPVLSCHPPGDEFKPTHSSFPRSRHLLFFLHPIQGSLGTSGKEATESWGSPCSTNTLRCHSKIDKGVSKLSLFSCAILTVVISSFLSNNWFNLQSPIAAAFIRIAQSTDDLEAQVCSERKRGNSTTFGSF